MGQATPDGTPDGVAASFAMPAALQRRVMAEDLDHPKVAEKLQAKPVCSGVAQHLQQLSNSCLRSRGLASFCHCFSPNFGHVRPRSAKIGQTSANLANVGQIRPQIGQISAPVSINRRLLRNFWRTRRCVPPVKHMRLFAVCRAWIFPLSSGFAPIPMSLATSTAMPRRFSGQRWTGRRGAGWGNKGRSCKAWMTGGTKKSWKPSWVGRQTS